MNNKFIQYIPGFVETGYDPFEFEFNTTEELLSNEWIHNWSRHSFDFSLPSPDNYFYRYSISDNYLMCELENGKKWYVIGSIKYLENVYLPKWDPIYDNKKG